MWTIFFPYEKWKYFTKVENIHSLLKNLDSLEGFLDVVEDEIEGRFSLEGIDSEISYQTYQNLKTDDVKAYRVLTKAMNPKFSLFGAIDERLFRVYSDIHTLREHYQEKQRQNVAWFFYFFRAKTLNS